MFNDFAFRDGVRLAGVNSINFARVLAQVVYYFTSAVSLGAPHRAVSFCVPTGNFGDIFAGYLAGRMGLPIEKLIDRDEPERHPAPGAMSSGAT
jgi:threonine synthase